MQQWVSFAPILGLLGLIFAGLLYWSVLRRSAGTREMQEIADAIHDGAMAFLRREYTILALFIAAVALLLAWQLGASTAGAFVGGAACSILAGFSGMKGPGISPTSLKKWDCITFGYPWERTMATLTTTAFRISTSEPGRRHTIR